MSLSSTPFSHQGYSSDVSSPEHYCFDSNETECLEHYENNLEKYKGITYSTSPLDGMSIAREVIHSSLNFFGFEMLVFLSLIRMIFCSFICVVQSDCKSLAAYSSVCHIGFVLLSIVLAIGGLREKLLASLRGSVKTVVIPSENKKEYQQKNKQKQPSS
ncbi:unnamed protein product [Onchocerca ochengi]|uniref:NADH:ubiquinone reductase (H(+)-translocating) n=1 Tax=Onchocerca ochengi TaxID=42157 RepID=A0A182EI13_ONCOC|nr:unnamed protein product [Onchocerca ochengi]